MGYACRLSIIYSRSYLRDENSSFEEGYNHCGTEKLELPKY